MLLNLLGNGWKKIILNVCDWGFFREAVFGWVAVSGWWGWGYGCGLFGGGGEYVLRHRLCNAWALRSTGPDPQTD